MIYAVERQAQEWRNFMWMTLATFVVGMLGVSVYFISRDRPRENLF